MNSTSQQPYFGDLLRSWRSERQQSQAELALKVETPPRHISFLETGRSKPSRDMVFRLSAALGIPLRDRNLLLRAAGLADAYAVHDINSDEMSTVHGAVIRLMTAHDPNPSFAIDRTWNIVDMNASAQFLIAHLVGDLPSNSTRRLNLLDLAFDPRGLRPHVDNWEDFATQTVQRLHREALCPEDLRTALNRIKRHPDLPERWWDFDVKYTPNPVFPICLNLGGAPLRLFSVIASIAMPTNALAQELRVETFFPVDDEAEAFIARLNGKN
ncbi:helix-turn-helix transcriptional regulator [Octadecabacter sp. SW4]|uniref:helix-turn-helix domain-containing protein n=1 Tax=Octadecabacter sp. SW4 TaxID=2602067 RepID=UPI0011C1E9AD|nr:helix-turn-helix transcriptional regulator [Octadecabacter sp. SW4]QEE35720.1 helix-turn-helix transcriptional regulator [Octadecabacter sp. SW4]